VNDPTTAVQTLDAIDGLLRILVRRNLEVQQIDGSDGTARLVVKLPTWEDYVSVALDEIISMDNGSPLVRDRVCRLLEQLLALAPPQHRASIEVRLESVSARIRT
jgi:uncharacterized membrane protein